MTYLPGTGPRTVGELVNALLDVPPSTPVVFLDGWEGCCWLDPLVVGSESVGLSGRVPAGGEWFPSDLVYLGPEPEGT